MPVPGSWKIESTPQLAQFQSQFQSEANLIPIKPSHLFPAAKEAATRPPTISNKKSELTILNITLLNLLQDLRPNLSMAFLVFLHTLRFELDDLRDATALVLQLD